MTDLFNTDNLPYDLSSDELSFLIRQAYPAAVHGVDFWCAHRVKANSAERISPAIIALWALDVMRPNANDIQFLATTHAVALADYRAHQIRIARMPNISARQLWLMALDIEITKAAMLAMVDGLPDQKEAARLRIELTEPPKLGYERFSEAAEKFRILQKIPENQFDDLWVWASQIK